MIWTIFNTWNIPRDTANTSIRSLALTKRPVVLPNKPESPRTWGRLLTFPNTLQHRVSPFSLADNTKPGHRKILALFLVDPNLRIISSANVPPQDELWWKRKEVVDQRLDAMRLLKKRRITD
ncbi:hypothetical protein N7519_005518 [Penicillium mononematosum]|uniref:uncharacterized protein n=1 Tax=Penicillium mononematosum TaxID=268346 RepID=UPI002548F2C8|nr:uncharacterized protein N7519_005518 [Penicillium mononematosum]KAJ6184217.1 hypothetical protein N7519_005518 [Penicillium mononematosum]